MWQINKDLASLFEHNSYAPIDGLRAISCIMITTLHVIILLNLFISPYPSEDWMNYLKTYSFRLTPLISLSLETFFMLSGLLLTLKCLKQKDIFTANGYVTFLFKRACRFWPGMLLISLIMLLLGESEGDWMSFWLFYQNCISSDRWSAGFGSLWSISLDMQIYIILSIIFFLILTPKKDDRRTYWVLYFLVIIAIVYSLIVFDPKTMDLPTIGSQYNVLATVMPPKVFDWILINYNVTFPFGSTPESSPIKPFMDALYFPPQSRYSSFVIGSILALNLTNISSSNYTQYKKWKKYFYYILIGSYLLLLTNPAEPGQINDVLLTVMISINRQLYTISQAFILFSALSPKTHPYHSTLMAKFLSMGIWSPIAKLSYLIYVLHFRIAFELILLNHDRFGLNLLSTDVKSVVWVSLVIISCIVLSTIWFVLVEKPVERFLDRLFSKKKTHTS